MKSRRQTGRGGAAAAGGLAADGSHHTHTTSSGCGGGVAGRGGCSKMERKDVEKNRRLHMKGLCLKLSSLLPASSSSAHHLRHYSTCSSSSPPSSNKDAATQLDQLDSAAAYIKQLRGRIDDLKRRKQATAGCSSSVSAGDYKGAQTTTAALPVIEVRCHDGSTLDVALASEAERPFRLHEVIAVLEQEGAEVVSASFSVVGDKIFYTVHSQALCPRIGLEAGRVAQRLRGLAAAAAPTVSSSVLLT